MSTIGSIIVFRTQCLIFFETPGPPFPPFPPGAVLWDDNLQPPSSSELILRSMWLSLATKAMEEKWDVEVLTDSGTGLVAWIGVTDTNTTESSISLPTNEQQRADLVQQLLNQRKQSLAESPNTAP
jgi:hypothetical protein